MVSTTQDIASNCEKASATAEESTRATTEGVSKVQSIIDKIENQVTKSRADAKLVQGKWGIKKKGDFRGVKKAKSESESD